LVRVTVAPPLPLPPVPEQLNVKVVVPMIAPVEAVPLVACDPLQPPDAVHAVAFVEFHVSVVAAPLGTLVGLAVIMTVGAGTTVTLAEPPPEPPMPVQVSV
jgi:hypothetical protein